ncbi:CHASE2 domain-containing protein [Sphaerothrix gracilis]|uniref:CHASE2 domain-containing protein n=1 Tax=Sphaerothrix gracilis TaxID=3151835 RepID=UPI0031FC94C4
MASSIERSQKPATLREVIIARLMRWRIGLAIVGLIVIARAVGLLESSELFFLDLFLEYRLQEATDSRITIIGIDEHYTNPDGLEISEQESYLTDQRIVELINTIFESEPAVVGLDFFIDKPRSENEQKTDRAELIKLFQQRRNLVGVQKLFEPSAIGPPPELQPYFVERRIGFNDFPTDAADGKVRRSYLGVLLKNEQEEDIFYESFALKLSSLYLRQQGLVAENGKRDTKAIRFGDTEIPRLKFGAGGYFGDRLDGQVQTLINFRSGAKAFEFISASQLMSQEIDEDRVQDLIQGRLIIIGNTDYRTARTIETVVARSIFQNSGDEPYAPSDKTEADTAAFIYRISDIADQVLQNVSGAFNQTENETDTSDRIFGIEIQAHATSQILSAVLDSRPLFWTLSTLVRYGSIVEYGFIVGLGAAGILVGKLFASTVNGFLCLGLVNICVLGISYLILFHSGLWLPVFPAFMAVSLNGIAYIAFYQSERTWKSLVRERDQALAALENERQQTVERAFAAIHSGPLQTLADILRHVRDKNISNFQVLNLLENLNVEIRDLGEHLRQEIVLKRDSVLLQGNIKIDLSHPMHELFYEVYKATLENNCSYPGFQSLQVRTVSFDPIYEGYLSLQLKRKLCHFLAEILCNVGKHAKGTTRLNVSGRYKDSQYVLKVSDNGSGIVSFHEGEGTRFCQKLASSLHGKFIRQAKHPTGTLCMLTWAPQPVEATTSSILST